VNAFFVREFQLMHVAEDAARFLHHACRGLPQRLLPGDMDRGRWSANSNVTSTAAAFYTRVIEDAVGYFGSRVLYPARPASGVEHLMALSFNALEKAASVAVRSGEEIEKSIAKAWGYRLGSMLYDSYLAGRVKPAGLRRLFLAHLHEPGVARQVCKDLISRVRSTARNPHSPKAEAFFDAKLDVLDAGSSLSI
jgi:hypothetical protein